MIPPRISLVTLGVASVAASRAFYEGLGWRASGASQEGIALFQLGPVVLSLFNRADLAGVTLAQNLDSTDEVDRVYAAAVAAGATPLKPPQPAFWGGYTACFADPDGFAWEIAHNPFFALDGSGVVSLPE